MENKLGNAMVMISMVASVAITSVIGAACSSSSGDSAGAGGAGGPAGGSGGAAGGADAGYGALYVKYGAAIPKVVDDAVAGVLADCVETPYFAVVGTAGHDSVARIKSCLRLQFTAVMGGPATYPGVNDMGEMCADMQSIHNGLGIPGDVFDKFVMDLGGVLIADGVSQEDVGTIAAAVAPLKGQIVAANPVIHDACAGGTADAGAQ
jgi:hypothetical protein